MGTLSTESIGDIDYIQFEDNWFPLLPPRTKLEAGRNNEFRNSLLRLDWSSLSLSPLSILSSSSLSLSFLPYSSFILLFCNRKGTMMANSFIDLTSS